MFKKFVDKGGFKEKKEYSYSYEGFDFEEEYEDDEEYEEASDSGYEERSYAPRNVYHGSTTASGLAIEIYHACKPYLKECKVDISGSARWIVHVWCDKNDNSRIESYIQSDFSDEPIGEIIFHHVPSDYL